SGSARTKERESVFLYTLRLRIRMPKPLFPLLLTASLMLSASAQTPKPSGWRSNADHIAVSLWPNGAPGPSTTKGSEQDITTSKDRQVADRPVVRLGNVSS